MREIAARLVRNVPNPRIAVLAGAPVPEAAAELRGIPGAQVHVHVLPQPLEELHLRCAADGPFDLIVDVAGGRVGRRFKGLALHTRFGGAIVARLPEPDETGPGFLAQLAAHKAGAEGTYAARSWEALLSSVELLDGHVVAVNGTDALSVVPEEQQDRFAELRPRDRVLAVVPGVTWESRAMVRTSSPTPFNPLPETYAAPQLALREHHDVVCLPGRAAYVESSVLAGSYRFHHRPQLRHPALQPLVPGFVRRPAEQPRHLPGVWYQLGSPVPGHFGHALTEQVAHLWGWERAREEHPGIRALVHAPVGKPSPDWLFEVLGAGGVQRRDVEIVEGAVRVDALVDATSMYEIGSHVHPAMAETWERIGSSLAARASDRRGTRRIFHTRRSARRRCHQQAEVERIFADAGFEILRPERHPLPEQVAMVRGADVLAGFAGSGMFHMALAGRPLQVIAVTSQSYPAHNEYQMAATLGHRLDLVVCEPDIPRTEANAKQAFYSDFSFRADGPEGRFLADVLATLPRG